MEQLKIEYEDDWEEAHRKMDECIINLLIDLGYKAGVDVFLYTHKWYA